MFHEWLHVEVAAACALLRHTCLLSCCVQAGAPIYVRKSVWDACATPLRNSSTWPTVNFIKQEDERRAGGSGGSSSGERRGSG